MIAITRRPLDSQAENGLRNRQKRVDSVTDFQKRVKLARSIFKRKNNRVFKHVREVLSKMCTSEGFCMYCEVSLADEIEHFTPLHHYPGSAFQWSNYLYACGPCNGFKSDRFQVILPDGSTCELQLGQTQQPPDGRPLAVDPEADDPANFISLDIAGGTFYFRPVAGLGSLDFARAEYTIHLLGLNSRDELPSARQQAYGNFRARLKEYTQDRDRGVSSNSLRRHAAAITGLNHPTVWREMQRQHPHIPELRALFQAAPEALNW